MSGYAVPGLDPTRLAPGCSGGLRQQKKKYGREEGGPFNMEWDVLPSA